LTRFWKVLGCAVLAGTASCGILLWDGLTPRGIYYPMCEGEPVYQVLTTKGGRVSWSKSTGRIAFDSQDLPEAVENGSHLVYSMAADGSDIQCVTCGVFPKGWTIGNPSWGPEGRWLVVQVADNACGVNRNLTSPGGGFASDLYAVDTHTGKAKLIRDVPCDDSNGVLHANVSDSGEKLSWSEVNNKVELFTSNLQFGGWTLMTANIDWAEEGPVLSDIEGRVPGITGFYENHGFSADGSRLIYTASNQDEPGFQQTTISELELDTGKVSVIATTGFNEHAKYVGNGESILFMSDPNRTVMLSLAGYRDNDYHVARLDGRARCQLTSFNEEGEFPSLEIEGHPSDEFSYAVTDVSSGPEPDAVVGRMIVNAGHPLPVGNLGAENWIVKITSPFIANGLPHQTEED